MNVKQLIDILNKLPEDYQVNYFDKTFEESYKLDNEDVKINHESKEINIGQYSK